MTFSNITELYETEYDLDGNGNPTITGRPGIPSIDVRRRATRSSTR